MTDKSFKALIVEDNDNARLSLVNLLESFPFIQIAATAKTVDEATLAYLKHRPELFFLDVELDNRSGFEFLENISGLTDHLKVIFTTAHQHYALKAIKHSAFDYLLKPIDPQELALSLEKIRMNGQNQSLAKSVSLLNEGLKKNKPLKLNVKHGFILLYPADILYCTAEWSYTDIYTTNGSRHTVTQNLGTITEQLSVDKFLRANRSLLLNLSYLHKVDKTRNQLILKNGDKEKILPITNAKIRKLENLLGGME